MSRPELRPPLPLNDWQDTYSTLHLWTQIVGKSTYDAGARLAKWGCAALEA